MLQIKTIREKDPYVFDSYVNEALREGWTLARRLTSPDCFIAEMEKEVITEAEQCCENCKHKHVSPEREPCLSCSETGSEWEAKE